METRRTLIGRLHSDTLWTLGVSECIRFVRRHGSRLLHQTSATMINDIAPPPPPKLWASSTSVCSMLSANHLSIVPGCDTSTTATNNKMAIQINTVPLAALSISTKEKAIQMSKYSFESETDPLQTKTKHAAN